MLTPLGKGRSSLFSIEFSQAKVKLDSGSRSSLVLVRLDLGRR